MSLHLGLAESASSAPGDFGARLKGDSIMLPQDVLSALERLAIRNGAEFVSYLHAFPASMASTMGWSVDEVLQGSSRLFDQLRGALPEAILTPAPAPVRRFGALPPPPPPLPCADDEEAPAATAQTLKG